VATSEQAAEVAKSLRASIRSLVTEEVADSTRILYGGSVKSANVAGFLASEEVDGVLVGGASLDVGEFSGICRFQKHVSL
jgi:triosephosphate isomerase